MSLVDELRRLKELHYANALTAEEFAQAKLLLLQGDLSGDTPDNAPAVAAEPVPESTPYQAIESAVAEMVTQLDDSRSQPEPIETTPPVQQPEPARNVDKPELWLTTVQTGNRELTVQIHNPTDKPIAARLTRSPYFDFIACDDFDLNVPAGQTVEYYVTADVITKSSKAETRTDK